MIDSENRSVELNELILAAELSDLNNLTDLNDLNDLILSISICWYCEVSATWLIEEQIRDIELNLLLKMLNLSFSVDLIDLNNLIDDLIELYFFAFVNDVSTRIFLLIWSTSATTMYSCSKKRNDFVLNVFDLKRFFKFDIASIAICEFLAIWLIEKQIRNVELKQLMKILNLIDLIDVKFD